MLWFWGAAGPTSLVVYIHRISLLLEVVCTLCMQGSVCGMVPRL